MASEALRGSETRHSVRRRELSPPSPGTQNSHNNRARCPTSSPQRDSRTVVAREWALRAVARVATRVVAARAAEAAQGKAAIL